MENVALSSAMPREETASKSCCCPSNAPLLDVLPCPPFGHPGWVGKSPGLQREVNQDFPRGKTGDRSGEHQEEPKGSPSGEETPTGGGGPTKGRNVTHPGAGSEGEMQGMERRAAKPHHIKGGGAGSRRDSRASTNPDREDENSLAAITDVYADHKVGSGRNSASNTSTF